LAEHVYRFFLNAWQKLRVCWCSRQTTSHKALAI
jgi:hypothetical protein